MVNCSVYGAVPGAVLGPGEVTRAEERKSELYWVRMKMYAPQNSLSLSAAMEDLEDPVLVRNRFSLTLQLQKRQTPRETLSHFIVQERKHNVSLPRLRD